MLLPDAYSLLMTSKSRESVILGSGSRIDLNRALYD